MNVKIIMISFVVFAIVMTIYFDGDMDQKQMLSNTESPAKDNRVDNVKILYEKRGDNVDTPALIQHVGHRDNMIIVETYDERKKFKIALLASGSSIINDDNHTILFGKLDDSTFKLKVPLRLMDKEQDNVILEITNLALNQVQRTPLVFLNELKNKSVRHTLNVSSKNISNYEYTTEKGDRLPGSNKLY